MTKKNESYPYAVGVVAFKDGSYDCYPHLAEIPPSEKYVRADLADARVEKLREALKEAKRTIKALHGDVAWDIYDRASPEMKKINAALAETETR